MQVSSAPRRLWRYLVGYRARVIRASLYSILNKLFDLAPPFLIGTAVDIVVRRQNSLLADLGVVEIRHQLWTLAALTVLIWGLESLFEYIYAVAWRNLAQDLQHRFRLDAYDHVQRLDLSFFEDRSTGGLMSVLNDDVNQLERFLDGGANQILQLATTVIVVGGVFLISVPTVAWMAFLPIPFIYAGSIRFQRAIGPRYARVREEVGRLNGLLSNNLTGVATIKSYVAEDYELERVRRASLDYSQANQRAIRLSAAFVPVIRMLIVAGFVGILVAGGEMVVRGTLNVGVYSVMIFLTQRLLWPITQLGATLDLYQRSMASTARLLDLLDTQPRLHPGTTELTAAQGHLQLDQVTFAYPDRAPALVGLDLDIPAGRTTAVVGMTGAGKSTIVKLLLRFYDPQQGRVTLDGHDLRDLTYGALRGAIGLVSQEVFLLDATVAENIGYGSFGAERSQIEAAARVAEAHDFISALPQGYDTLVGERGQKLSGGQRQRLSLARAILKDPPVLILDEATSSVDNETEAAIQRSLEVISRDRTVLVIAHRLSTVRSAHEIVVLDRGRPAERGTHEQLLAHNGLYAALWRVQTGEPVVADPGTGEAGPKP